ncbi:MAG: peptidase T [Spirochaetales bacterium]|jgi:tripeptide aminopeptidase|nr:peptidase T [Spirochaetales bacterium]
MKADKPASPKALSPAEEKSAAVVIPEKPLLDRFLRYVKIDTTSDSHIAETPSTPGQWDLLRLLEKELKDLSIKDITLDKKGFLIARLPGNAKAPVIGFMAHVDTSGETSGRGVNPQVIRDYQGKPLVFEGGFRLDPREFPQLLDFKGQTIITTDGTTLLGADDKAGAAEIMSAAAYLLEHPEIKRGDVELIFTPDEETGKGMDSFPLKSLRSQYCYTLDGGAEGEIEAECFNAYGVKIRFTGRPFHLGAARGRMVNAVTMAGTFISLLPGRESPEATDERQGYYCPLEVKGTVEEAELMVFLRDFDSPGMARRIAALKKTAEAVQALFSGGRVEALPQKQYLNMIKVINQNPKGLRFLERAVHLAGAQPCRRLIRGGTDGARLSEMGIPTPNIWTGGYNFHSRYEWAALPSMLKAAAVVVHLVRLWAE